MRTLSDPSDAGLQITSTVKLLPLPDSASLYLSLSNSAYPFALLLVSAPLSGFSLTLEMLADPVTPSFLSVTT